MNQSRDFPDGRQPIGASSASLALLTSMLWGGTPVAIKYSQDVLPPLAVAAIHFALAALFMLEHPEVLVVAVHIKDPHLLL